MDTEERVYRVLVADQEAGCKDLPAEVCREVPGNALRIISAQTLQSIGDRIVDAKTVLPWLLTALGVPAGFIGLLVPVRESGSLLPQAPIAPWVRRRSLRKWVWVAGGAGQALSVAGMALAAATTSGAVAGVAILAALAVFAVARSLTSIASKDVLGRTIPKGQRGQINGVATVTSGAVAMVLGLGLRALGGDEMETGALAALLFAAALVWIAALAVYATVREQPTEDDPDSDVGWLARSVQLLRDDAPFRHFVLVRTLLLVSALSPPFVVALAAEEADASLAGLGPFLIASGLSGVLGGWFFGRIADRSSRGLMAKGAGAASAIIAVLLVLRTVPEVAQTEWLYPVTYLLLTLAHTGVRVARKTYVVDLASGNRRTDYVAVSNTAMGLLLLVTGAVSSGLAQLGVQWALAFLAALGLVGVLVSRALPELSEQT